MVILEDRPVSAGHNTAGNKGFQPLRVQDTLLYVVDVVDHGLCLELNPIAYIARDKRKIDE